MKRLLVLAITFIFISILSCGCVNSGGQFNLKNSVENMYDTTWNMKYDFFDGYKYISFEIPQDKTCRISFDIKTDTES